MHSIAGIMGPIFDLNSCDYSTQAETGSLPGVDIANDEESVGSLDWFRANVNVKRSMTGFPGPIPLSKTAVAYS